ncbi:MAG: Rpp14/Pop5 family protein [Candidatus Bathyarchaeia archaeon]|nr:Rpp14/Pop5 family protein [Candidatus Bathyarchaeia archaeon]
MLKREKRRYLALTAEGEQVPNEQAVLDAVQASLHRLFGEYGASKTNLKLIKKYPEKEQIVVCCSHKALEKVRAAIASTTIINGKTGAIHVLGISGTLKALSKKTETN